MILISPSDNFSMDSLSYDFSSHFIWVWKSITQNLDDAWICTQLSPHCFEIGANGHGKQSNCCYSTSFYVLSVIKFSNLTNPEIWLGILIRLESHETFSSLCFLVNRLTFLLRAVTLKMYSFYIADVLVRSSYPGRGLQWKLRCI